MVNEKITIIGGGNMGASLLGGLIANHYPPQNIWITDTEPSTLQKLQTKFNVHVTTNNLDAISDSSIIILAVKPNILSTVCKELASPIQQKRPLILSIAAGITIASLEKWLGDKIAIVRAMPNTPALIGCGATALYANQYTTPAQRNIAETILRSVSIVIWLEQENLMDVVTAVSGSGPAYFFLIIEALQNAAEELGLTEEQARLLTLQTAYGASRMALGSEMNAKELRACVTSKGGTTEAAIRVFEEENIHQIIKNALNAAKKRSEELGKSNAS